MTQQRQSLRRLVARQQTWWLRLFVISVVLGVLGLLPFPEGLAISAALLVLALIRPPHSDSPPIRVAAPVRGRWVVLNGPGTKVPSHGIIAYGQKYAVDMLHPLEEEPDSIGWGLRGRPPESYSCFGETVRSMTGGTVVAVHDRQADRSACSTWPSLVWMMTFGGLLCELRGSVAMLGNHVIVKDGDVVAVYAHLRHASGVVEGGEQVRPGQPLAEVGNTGNTSEPHLHVQLMDREQPTAAAGIPMEWDGAFRDTGQRDPRWETSERKKTAMTRFPPDGQVVEL